MIAKIKKGTARGRVSAPASKSMAHRYLICAALSENISRIGNIAYSEDILATLDCLEAMGAVVERKSDSVIIKGVSPEITEEKTFSCRESGSTLRFMLPVLLLSERKQKFSGYGRLMERPMGVYEDICAEQGLTFGRTDGKIFIKGQLKSGSFTVRGDISSQFISGLLFALVLCEGDSILHITDPVESRSYINMTVAAMKKFGIGLTWQDSNTIYIKGSQKYHGADFSVEGDYSNAAFLDAFSLIGGEVQVTGLSENSLQGDRIYKEYFNKLKEGAPTLDVKDCPDLAPVLMTMAAALGGCKLTGTARLKIKECDRGRVMAHELRKFGADIELSDNEITVKKAELHKPTEILYGHNDHRIVMSLCVLLTKFGGEIKGSEAVKKSFPDFFYKMKEMGLEVELYDDK